MTADADRGGVRYSIFSLGLAIAVAGFTFAAARISWFLAVQVLFAATCVIRAVRRRHRNAAVMACVGLAGLLLIPVGCWIHGGSLLSISPTRVSGRAHFLHEIEQSAELFRQQRGRYPKTLDELVRFDSNVADRIAYRIPNADLTFDQTGMPKIIDYGDDGLPGGVGWDADMTVDNRSAFERRVPLTYFLFEFPGWDAFGMATALIVFPLGILSLSDPSPQSPIRKTVLTGGVTLVLATVAGVGMGLFHLAASQSGH